MLIPFVSIDPHKGKLGVREARKLIEEYGVRGFKFHPTMQGFYANDRMAYPLYEAISDGGAIALFHTGQTGVGSGMPGGMGMRLKYSNPMYMDDVAADFPDLKIILAHPSFPWQEEALSVATHKPNVYIDLSGWSPKYFPPILVRYINSILQDKMLFGSDWPVITPDRWLADFAKLEIRDEIRPKVLKANARKLLGIPDATASDRLFPGAPIEQQPAAVVEKLDFCDLDRDRPVRHVGAGDPPVHLHLEMPIRVHRVVDGPGDSLVRARQRIEPFRIGVEIMVRRVVEVVAERAEEQPVVHRKRLRRGVVIIERDVLEVEDHLRACPGPIDGLVRLRVGRRVARNLAVGAGFSDLVRVADKLGVVDGQMRKNEVYAFNWSALLSGT